MTTDTQLSYRDVQKGTVIKRISIWKRHVENMPGIAFEVRVGDVAVQHPFTDALREAEMYRAGFVEALVMVGWLERDTY